MAAVKRFMPTLAALAVIGCDAAPAPHPPVDHATDAISGLADALRAQSAIREAALEAERAAHAYEVCQYKRLVGFLLARLQASGQTLPKPPPEVVDLSGCEPRSAAESR